MDPEDGSIFDTVMRVVTRYGMKRTTMAELAHGAGVSRQTLYDRFGDKDGIMAATIAHLCTRISTDLQAAFAQDASLAEKLDAYFSIAVWPTFRLIQDMPDAADFEKGMGPASITASQKLSAEKQQILATMLRDHLGESPQSPHGVAVFIEQSSGRAKMADISREDLESFLSVLKASIVALARTR